MELNIDKSNWKKVLFGDVVQKVTNKIDPETYHSEIVIQGGHINKRDFHIREYENKIELGYLGPAFHMGFKKHQILYVSRNPHLMKVGYPHFDGICANTTFIMETKDESVLRNDLIPFIMHSDTFIEQSVANVRGGVNPYVNWSDLASIEFLLPPKDQQAQLAKLLWDMDKVVEARVKHSEQISLSRHYVLENRIIQFSENTRLSTLGEIGKWISGGTPSKKTKEYWENGNVLWVTPKDMKSDKIDSTLDMVTEHAVKNGKSKLFKAGSTVLVWRSGILQHTLPIVQVEQDFTVNQDLKVFQSSNENFSEEYVRIYLVIYAEKIRRACVKEGTTVQSISTDSFLRFNIPALNEVDQNELVKEEAAFKVAIDQSMVALKNSRSLQKSLINQVF